MGLNVPWVHNFSPLQMREYMISYTVKAGKKILRLLLLVVLSVTAHASMLLPKILNTSRDTTL